MSKMYGAEKGKGGLHIKGKGGTKHTIGAKDMGGPAKKGKRIVLGSHNQGSTDLGRGVTK